MKPYYTYLLRCADGTLYCGFTDNVEKRVEAHNNGRDGAKYTKTRRPVYLVAYIAFDAKDVTRLADDTNDGLNLTTEKLALRCEWWVKHQLHSPQAKLDFFTSQDLSHFEAWLKRKSAK
ncbi:MAG: GIY-YIG nuclease family protein [Streptococcaceae bacterium]|nr:GIY-YIG nuclease family protein [Streptococcaceae bacterium]